MQSLAKLDKHNLYFVQIDVNAHDKMLMGHIDNREYNITKSYVETRLSKMSISLDSVSGPYSIK